MPDIYEVKIDHCPNQPNALNKRRYWASILRKLQLQDQYGVEYKPEPKGYGIYLSRHDGKPMPGDESNRLALKRIVYRNA